MLSFDTYLAGKKVFWCGTAFGLFLFSGVTGCGSGSAGTSGGGGGTPSVPAPAITSINPSSATAGSSATTLSITGSNFAATDTVKWNGSELQSTYGNPTTIFAVVPANDLATAGTESVTVSAAIGATSNAETFTVTAAPPAKTVVRTMNVFPKDLVWDAKLGKLLASFASTDTTNPNSVAAIDPVAMTVGTAVAAGNDPNRISISSDGSYLWIALDGDYAVQRFLLPGLTKDISIPVPGPLGNDGTGKQQAVCVQAAPVNPHAVAIVAGNEGYSPAGESVYVYDDGVQRPNLVPVGVTNGAHSEVDWIQWGSDDTSLYGTQYTTIDSPGLTTMSVNASGATFGGLYGGDALTLVGITQYDKASGLLYGSYEGQAIDVNAHSLAGYFNTGETGNLACTVDSSLGRNYCVVNVFNGYTEDQFSLEVFDQKSYALLETVDLTGVVSGYVTKLVRWGNAGLAVTAIPSSKSDGGTYPGGLFLIDGAAVNPNVNPDVSAGTAVTPYESLVSLSPQSAPSGSGDVSLTLTGANFTPNSEATFNSNYIQVQSLVTKYVNSTTLNVTIPASMLATPQAINISVYDASEPSYAYFGENSLTFTVTPAASAGATLTSLNLAALALAWDAGSGQLYIGTSDRDPVYPNSIVAVKPANGAVTGSQVVDAEPYLLSVSAGGQFLYAGFAGATNVTQLELPDLKPLLTWPLITPKPTVYGVGPYFAGDLKSAPVNPHTVATTLFIEPGILDYTPTEIGGLAIYDDATQRPNLAPGIGPLDGHPFDTLSWGATDSTLYSASFGGPTPLDLVDVSSTGAAFDSYLATFTGNSGNLHFDAATGLIYNDDGEIADPVSKTIVGNLNASGLVVPDSTLSRVFVLGQTQAQAEAEQNGQNSYTIESIDEKTLQPVGSTVLSNILGSPIALVRWGTNGLALITFNETPGGYGGPSYGGPGGMLYILQDNTFVSNAKATVTPEERVQQRWIRLTPDKIAAKLKRPATAAPRLRSSR